MLNDPRRLLDNLFTYDKDNIPERCIHQLSSYIEDETCTPEMLRRVHVFGEAVCLWLRSVYKYHFAARNVEPFRLRLRQSEAELQEECELLSVVRVRYEQH